MCVCVCVCVWIQYNTKPHVETNSFTLSWSSRLLHSGELQVLWKSGTLKAWKQNYVIYSNYKKMYRDEKT